MAKYTLASTVFQIVITSGVYSFSKLLQSYAYVPELTQIYWEHTHKTNVCITKSTMQFAAGKNFIQPRASIGWLLGDDLYRHANVQITPAYYLFIVYGLYADNTIRLIKMCTYSYILDDREVHVFAPYMDS